MFGPGQAGDKLFDNNYSYHGTLFSTYSLTDATWHLVHVWLALVIMIVIFIFITTLFLVRKDRRGFGRVRHKCIKCKQKLLRPNAPFCPKCGKEQFT